ncbi:MAG: transcription antitermination factor NusB [Elusimicrobiota bacterium]|jgi:N utilization substance protein B|nr:transcription antitermination factor NusB [Elusimicrobiota bacterium]
MATRHEARIIAMHILYSIDVCKLDKNEAFESYFKISEIQNIDNIREFLNEVVDGTINNLKLIDSEILKVMKNWDLDRLADIDRTILRLATFELFFMDNVPINVVINEAIDLSKEYSTDNSGKFINGILDSLKMKREVFGK